MFENANNQYLMCTKRVDKFKNTINIGKYKFQYGNTNVVHKEISGKAIIILEDLLIVMIIKRQMKK